MLVKTKKRMRMKKLMMKRIFKFLLIYFPSLSSIAGEFARNGYQVLLFDTNKEMFEKSRASIRENLGVLQKGGIVTDVQIVEALDHVSYSTEIEVKEKKERKERKEKKEKKNEGNND